MNPLVTRPTGYEFCRVRTGLSHPGGARNTTWPLTGPRVRTPRWQARGLAGRQSRIRPEGGGFIGALPTESQLFPAEVAVGGHRLVDGAAEV